MVLSHPQLIEEALVTRARSFVKEKVLWGGWSAQLVQREGIGTLGSEDWQVHTQSRRRLQPAFAPACLEELRPVVRDVALDLIAGWRDGDGVDVPAAMRRFSVVAFSASMLGERAR